MKSRSLDTGAALKWPQGVRHSSPLPIKTEIVDTRSGSEAFFLIGTTRLR